MPQYKKGQLNRDELTQYNKLKRQDSAMLSAENRRLLVRVQAREELKFMKGLPRHNIRPSRFKIKRGKVLQALQTLKSASAESIGKEAGLAPQFYRDGVLFHLHALANDGTITRTVTDRNTIYEA